MKKDNLKFMVLVIALISVIMCISGFGLATWARYRSTQGGNVTAQIAKWSFKVNKQSEEFAEIDLAKTIHYEHVVDTTIAPGTQGSFDLEIDGIGSEVSLDYYINILIAKKPTNLKFYTDNTYSTELEIATDNRMYLDGELLLSGSMKETRTIYWDWAYRTNTLPKQAVLNKYVTEINGLQDLIDDYNTATVDSDKKNIAMKINDKIDTEEAGKQVLLQVNVRGVQINPEFAVKGVHITSSKNKVLDVGDTVELALEFTESVFADNSNAIINATTAPVVTIGFDGTTTANNPVAKIASLFSANLRIAEGENLATYVGVNDNKINYEYTVKPADKGNIKIENIVGVVYNRSGKELHLTAEKTKTEIIGGNVTTEVDNSESETGNPINPPNVSGTTSPQIKIGGETITLTEANAAEYYGKVVTNYNSNTSATWRLFYVDFEGDFGDGKGTIYLKADKLPTDISLDYTNTAGLKRMKQMNPQWAEKDNGIGNEPTLDNDNEKAISYLCDETVWAPYTDSNQGEDAKASYAIGAPSVEMYVKSYDAYHSKKRTVGYKELKCVWSDSKVSGYKLVIGGVGNYSTPSRSIKADENNMYVNSKEYAWWLASPSAGGVRYVCLVRGDSFYINYYYISETYGVCPVVSLKHGVIPEF